MSATMRVTMRQSRLGQAGLVLAQGQTYTIDRDFGLSLVGAGYADDTDDIRLLTEPNINNLRTNQVELRRIAGQANLEPAATYHVGPVRYRAVTADRYVAEALHAPGQLNGVVYDVASRAVQWTIDGVTYAATYTANSIAINGSDGYQRVISLDPQGRIDASTLLET